MPLFRSTNSIRSFFFSFYFSSFLFLFLFFLQCNWVGENVRRYRRRSVRNDHSEATFFNRRLGFQPPVYFRRAFQRAIEVYREIFC